jgi:hypothetical protein
MSWRARRDPAAWRDNRNHGSTHLRAMIGQPVGPCRKRKRT